MSPELFLTVVGITGTIFIALIVFPRRLTPKNRGLADEVIIEMQTANFTPAQIEAIDLWSWAHQVGWHSIHLDPERFPIFAERMRK